MTILAFVELAERVPADHPLRSIKALADEALTRLSPEFDRMYADAGRPSIPPERLLKASLLIGVFSVRSERALCEELDYNQLFRWFLGMQPMERTFGPTVFTKNRQRLLGAKWGSSCSTRWSWRRTGEACCRTSTSRWTARWSRRLRASRASSRETQTLPRTTATGATPRWTERSGVEESLTLRPR